LEFNGNFPEPNYSVYFGVSCTKLFELFFDNDIIQLLIDKSTKYAIYKGFPNPNLSIDEIKYFIGILLQTCKI